MAYDDGSSVEVTTPEDDPPSSGHWADPEEALHDPTEEELEAAEFLRQVIDPDDDNDNGLQWAGWTREMFEELAP
jgi:hypothetical protein